jgi:2-polyprenyl-6-methoxyphenol hydroxylase-like FAD-dependent oxidoreductase
MKDVLIVGAGPTGLTLALWLTKQGVAVRIIDQSAGPGETSRAMAVQARTLELYRQLDLTDAIISAGHKTPAVNMWVHGKRKAHILLGDAGADISPYPFVLVYPQDQHEQVLVERLRSLGVTVERNTEFIAFEDKGEYVSTRLRMPDGSERVCETRYLAGCDGARSPIRHLLGTGFEGGTYKHIFYVADVEVDNLALAGEVHIAFDRADFVLLMSYGDGNKYRLIGTVKDERAERAETLTFDDVSHDAIQGLGIQVGKVNWFSTYRVHHRVASDFRVRRTFLLGDAAHVHSPAGGQGMNTGINDAINLAWKLAAVLKAQAPDSLLDTYAIERQAFARKLVATTDRLFSFVTTEGDFADFVKTRIAPVFMGMATRIDSVREFMFRLVSQTMLSYPDSPLSEGKAGTVKGGDRLPWVPHGLSDNYAPLSNIGWQVHVYGTARPEIQTWCGQHNIPLHVFEWTHAHHKAGLAEDAVYLLRPDTYVAFAGPQTSVEALNRYFQLFFSGIAEEW